MRIRHAVFVAALQTNLTTGIASLPSKRETLGETRISCRKDRKINQRQISLLSVDCCLEKGIYWLHPPYKSIRHIFTQDGVKSNLK
jgi:hypothetical protein